MAKQPRILAGENAAITGGARGIGRATAKALLDKGMKVVLGDVDADAARATASELGARCVGLPLDVLVNNAGIMQVGRFVDEDDMTARRMVDINLHGVILGTKLALDRMIPRDRGHIVNISSQAGKFGAPGGATYSATKHAVVGLTEAVRGELRLMGAHIDVSYVMPAVVNTELGSGLGDVRGFTNLEPSEVADAIVDALQNGVVDVWVPKRGKRTNLVISLLPRRLSEGMGRALKADRVLADANPDIRRGYELRASHSEPALESGSEQPQLARSAGE